MSRFRTIERNGSFFVANSNKSKFWPSTEADTVEKAEAQARVFNLRHEMKKVEKLMAEMLEDNLTESDDLIEAGHEFNRMIDNITNEMIDRGENSPMDPRGWLA